MDAEGLLADRLTAELVRLMKLVDKVASMAHGPGGLERAHYVLLARLALDGPRRSGDLAEAVVSDPSTVSRQVAQLVRLGLVERQADQADGRASRLALTAAGERTYAEFRRLRNTHVRRLLADWSVADREQLIELLGRLGADLERYRASLTAGPGDDPDRPGGEH